VRSSLRLACVILTVAAANGVSVATGTGPSAFAAPAPAHRTEQACRLGNGIQHVIALQFDNVHFTRDTPTVPSDLEQMPHLLKFLTGRGSFLTNHHDVLSHTATNVLSAQTGLYADRHGVPQSNSFRYFNPDGTTSLGVSFGYWTDPLFDPTTSTPSDTRFNMAYSATRPITSPGRNVNTPAPWVPYTRAGCNVGAVAVGNTVLENTGIDVATVFGANSSQAAEVKANPGQAYADIVGLAVHCAAGSATCSSGQADRLPDEPGGYAGHQALFGNAQIAPAISPAGPVRSLSGQPISDGKGHVGFPGFDGVTPDNSLGYVADMQEHGIPVTSAYISDAHSDHTGGTGDFAPGQAGYVAQLRAYDAAFATFFERLARDGITPANTLFTVTTDEGDHFAGGPGTPAGCDGIRTACTYQQTGEVAVNLTGLLATQRHNTTPLTTHSDPAPSVYVTGNPARSAEVTRQLERDTAALRITDPYTGRTGPLAHQLADPVEERILHYVTADPARTPTFTAFTGENDYVFAAGPSCVKPCVAVSPGYNWIHGGIYSDMTNIWLGMVGPGVRRLGIDRTTWSDQTDIRPTTLALLGLHDDYQVDGRVLTEDLEPSALPRSLRAHAHTLRQLGAVYKQILAGAGQFSRDTLTISTRALASGRPGHNETYTVLERQLATLGDQRDQLANRMRSTLLGAAFDCRPLNEHQARQLSQDGRRLLARTHRMAASSPRD